MAIKKDKNVTGGGTEPENQDNQQEQPKTYTQDELNEMLQKESDKRVTQALETYKKKTEQDFNQKIKEVERLAKLSDEDREKEIKKKMENELIEERNKLNQERNLLEAEKMLKDKGLPVAMAKSLLGASIEETKAAIDTFETNWRASLQAEVNSKLTGTTPKGNANGDNDTEDPMIDKIKQIFKGNSRRY